MPREQLIIFAKNPGEGSVKTRIAEELGNAQALRLYRYLLEYTHQLTRDLPYDKALYYSDHIETEDEWEEALYQKHRQAPGDLGHRLRCAFSTTFQSEYQAAVAIGSDCLELKPEHLQLAFEKLKDHDLVIGPATDGGYYLIGMKKLQPMVFENMPWSSDQLLSETIRKADRLDLTYFLLPELSDIDVPADLHRYPELQAVLNPA